MLKLPFKMLLTTLMLVHPIWAQDNFLIQEESNVPYFEINLKSLTPENLKEFLAETHTPFILECAEGSIVPVNIHIKGDFLDQESIPTLYLKIMKTCYMKRSSSALLFSLDKTHWREFQEFFTGSLGVALSQISECADFSLSLELNQRG